MSFRKTTFKSTLTLTMITLGVAAMTATAQDTSKSPAWVATSNKYTEMLLASAAEGDALPERSEKTDAVQTHAGCVFAARCAHKLGMICDAVAPPVTMLSDTHAIACHREATSSAHVLPITPHPELRQTAGGQ